MNIITIVTWLVVRSPRRFSFFLVSLSLLVLISGHIQSRLLGSLLISKSSHTVQRGKRERAPVCYNNGVLDVCVCVGFIQFLSWEGDTRRWSKADVCLISWWREKRIHIHTHTRGKSLLALGCPSLYSSCSIWFSLATTISFSRSRFWSHFPFYFVFALVVIEAFFNGQLDAEVTAKRNGSPTPR